MSISVTLLYSDIDTFEAYLITKLVIRTLMKVQWHKDDLVVTQNHLREKFDGMRVKNVSQLSPV